MLILSSSERGRGELESPRWEGEEREREREMKAIEEEEHLRIESFLSACFSNTFSNYGPTIRVQRYAESKGCNQVLWLYGEEEYV